MKPEFIPFKVKRPESEIATGRIPAEFKSLLEGIAADEGDGVSGLVLEGIIRVLQNRSQDNEKLREVIHNYLSERTDIIESNLSQARTALELFTESSSDS